MKKKKILLNIDHIYYFYNITYIVIIIVKSNYIFYKNK